MADVLEAPAPAATPAAPGDDRVKNDFLAARAVAQSQPSAELNALMPTSGQVLATKNAPAQAAAPAAAPPAQGPAQYPMTAPHPAPDGSGAMTNLSDPDYAKFMRGENPGLTPQAVLDTASAAGRVAKDVGKGLLDAPRQIAGGLLDYGNNLMKFADGVVKQAEDAGLPNIYFQLVDKDGKWSPQVMSTEQFRTAQAAGDAGIFQVPTTGDPDTITGSIVRAATTFLAARKPTMAGAGETAGTGANLLADTLGGATGTDAGQPRLSNLIDGIAPNFATDWLKASPEDEDTLLGHLKAGLEYLGMGAAFKGVAKALTTAKQMGSASGVTDALDQTVPAEAGAPGAPGVAGVPHVDKGFTLDNLPESALGQWAEATKPLPAEAVQVAPEFHDLAQRFMAGDPGANPVRVNLDTISAPEHIKELIGRVSAMLPEREVQSWGETNIMAQTLGVQPADLMAGMQGNGSALSAAELRAASMVSISTATQAGELATAAMAPGATEADMQAALRAVGIHFQVAQYVAQVQGEAGRALNILGQVQKATPGYVQAVNDLIQNSGATDAKALLERIADLGNPETGGDPAKISAYLGQVAQGNAAQGRGLTVYYNVLLSNPATVVKKFVSDIGMGFWNTAVTALAERTGSGAVSPGEAMQLAFGYAQAQKEALRLAGKALVAGESQFHGGASTLEGFSPRLGALTEGAQEALDHTAPTQAAWEYLRAALPTSWIGSVDDWAKYSHYAAEVSRLAFRDSVDKGLTGEAQAEAIATMRANPPPAIQEQAWGAAQRLAFQEPLSGFAQNLQDGRDNLGVFGRVIVPFIKVPMNILKFSYTNTPLGAAFPSSAIRAELEAGGASRDMAIARMGLGGMVAWAAADGVLNQQITGGGPKDPELARAWRAAGNQPYSIKVGNDWYGYNHLEPTGMLVSIIGDTMDTMRFAHEQDADTLAASLMFGIGNAVLSKTYLQGLAGFFEGMNNPQKDGSKFAFNVVASMATPPGAAAAAQAIDPWVRAHQGLIQQMQARLPYMSQGLPPARTLWGDAIPATDHFLPPFSGTAAARMLSPVSVVPGDRAEPIDTWIWNNRDAFPKAEDGRLGIRKLSQTQAFNLGPGVTVNMPLTDQAHDRLQVLAGNELKAPIGNTQMGAKDYLNALVQGTNPDTETQKQWNGATPAAQAFIVQKVVRKFQEAARKQLLNEYPDIADSVASVGMQRAQQLQGHPGAPSGALAMPKIGGSP